MKRTFAFMVVISMTNFLFAQKTTPTAPELPRNEQTQKVQYQEVVDMPGVSAKELGKRAANWGKKYYTNWNGLGVTIDTVEGKIFAKPQITVYRTLKDGTKAIANVIKYSLTIDLKEGKYRITITDFTIKAASITPLETLFNENSTTKEDNYNQLSQLDLSMNTLMDSLKTEMEIPSSQVKKDDW